MGQVQGLGRCSVICTTIKYTDPAVQRHPEQTFSGLIWLKGLGILLRIALSFLQHSLSILPGRLSLQKCALDIGYGSRLAPIPHVQMENGAFSTSCHWNAFSLWLVLLSGWRYFSQGLRYFLQQVPPICCPPNRLRQMSADFESFPKIFICRLTARQTTRFRICHR